MFSNLTSEIINPQLPQGQYEHGMHAQRQNFEVHVDNEEPSSQVLRTPQHVIMDKVLSARKPEKAHSVMESLRKVCATSFQFQLADNKTSKGLGTNN